MVQLMPLPPRHLLLQQNPEQFILLVQAYSGGPAKNAIKRLCVCVSYELVEFLKQFHTPFSCAIHHSQFLHSFLPRL